MRLTPYRVQPKKVEEDSQKAKEDSVEKVSKQVQRTSSHSVNTAARP